MVLEVILAAALIGVGVRSHRRKHEKRYWREVARQEQVNNAALGAYATTLAARQNQAAGVVPVAVGVPSPVPVPVPFPVAVSAPRAVVQTTTYQQAPPMTTMGHPYAMGQSVQPQMVMSTGMSPRYNQPMTPTMPQTPRPPMNATPRATVVQMPAQQTNSTGYTMPPAMNPQYTNTAAPPLYPSIPLNSPPGGMAVSVHPDFFVPDTQEFRKI